MRDPDGESRLTRYSTRLFPCYRFIPGQSPHPRRHPDGHSFGLPEPESPAFAPEQWDRSETYLFAVDLFNFGYWWEAHEGWESLWHAAGRRTEQASFFRGLIQLAAAHLKRETGNTPAALNLTNRALERFRTARPRYMGIDVTDLIRAINDSFFTADPNPVAIRLVASPPG